MPLNKPELVALNQENFPDNQQQLITPVLLREFNDEMINSMELTQSMDGYANLGTANLFYGGNQSIAKEYKLFTNGVYWNNGTAGYNNLEIINSATGNIDIAALGGGVRIVSSSLNITNGTFTASLAEGYTYVGNSSGRTYLVATSSFGGGSINTGSLVTTASFNSYTQSTDIRLNNLESTSASVNVSISNLNSTTSSFGISIANLNTATQSLFTSASLGLVTASFDNGTRNLTFTKGNTTQFSVNIPDVSGSAINTGSFVTTSSFNSYTSSTDNRLTNIESATASLFIDTNNLELFSASALVSISNLNQSSASQQVSIDSLNSRSGSYATLGANTFTGSQTIQNSALTLNNTGSVFFNLNGTTQNNILFNSPSNQFTSYGSFVLNNNGNAGGSGSLSFLAVSSSISFASRDGFLFGRATPEGGTLANGGVKINTSSGSFVLAPSGFNVAGTDLLHLSSSSNSNNVNLIFKNSNTTADTIISGSNNIFSNPTAATAGFKRYIGGAQNVLISGTAIPQISGSMAFSPAMNNNTIVGAGGLIMRGPVSSSAWTISNNLINNTTAYTIGSAAATNAEQIVSGLTMSNNGGSVFPNIQAYKTPLSASFTYSTSTGAGTVVINLHSSSINYGGNASFGGTTINNLYFPTTVNDVSGLVSISSCQFLGTSNIIFSGSNASMTGETRRLGNSLMVGFNSASLVLNGDSGSLFATSILGSGLNVTGSNSRYTTLNIPNNDFGSVFVGRYNDQLGNKARTAETVFAVGTGTSNTIRKTGFLIDSGSNSFFEGTLSVSGSLTVQSGSTFFANGNKQFNVGAFQSGVTQSGSANVSQSMNFETTDISQGVSIVSNSRITLANSGTYNIQFSSQFDRIAGSGNDTIYVWLKKNGVNYNSSAGVLTVSGGANQAKALAAWNYVVDTLSTDYWELCWQASDTNIQMITFPAGGNIPSVPSVILTVTQVR